MWRCGNHAKVWYEWCTTAPQVRTQRVRLRMLAADSASTRRRWCTTQTGGAISLDCERRTYGKT